MMWKRRGISVLAVGVLAVVVYSWAWWAEGEPMPAAAPPPSSDGKARLAVLLVFDQLRGDYLEKWQDQFGEGGFKRLQQDGAWFTNCHYPYSDTFTAPGHASMATGCSPYKHGIVGNAWYERDQGKVDSVSSKRCSLVPRLGADEEQGADPHRRRVETVGDVLLRKTGNKARVVSLSIKDRSAILLAALRAICYWFSTSFGGFITSTHYHDTLHPFVSQFNKDRVADQWFDDTWDRLRPQLDYVKHSGLDDVAAEGTGYYQGRTFPHPFHKEGARRDGNYYNALVTSPRGNDLLLALAKRAIDALELGRKDVPDLLCVSFSSNDLVGHCWGPDSQEVLDMTLRTDRQVKELLDHLDARVGKGNYLVAVSADHGICPLPEVSRAQGKKAERVPTTLLTSRASDFLQEKFAAGKPGEKWVEASTNQWIYLQPAVLKEFGVTPAQAEKALADWLVQQPGVEAAATRAQVLGKGKLDDPFLESVRLSFDPERSGDVRVHLKPYHLLWNEPLAKAKQNRTDPYQTTHGSAHEYDTHVPLLVLGPKVQAGVRRERVTPQAIASILAHALNIPPPAAAEAAVPNKLFVQSP